MTTSLEIDKIAPAFLAAQKAIQPAAKNANNPHLNNKYANFASVWDAASGPLHDNNIAVVQDVVGTAVTTRLIHSSGQWFEFGPIVVPVEKPTAQGAGISISYACRYGLDAAVCGRERDDTDGVLPPDKKPQSKAAALDRKVLQARLNLADSVAAMTTIYNDAVAGASADDLAWFRAAADLRKAEFKKK